MAKGVAQEDANKHRHPAGQKGQQRQHNQILVNWAHSVPPGPA